MTVERLILGKCPTGSHQFRRMIGTGLIAVVLGGCGEADERNGSLVLLERDSAGVRVIELSDIYAASLPRWHLQPDRVIGEVAGSPEYELFRITGAIRLPDGSVAVANAGTAEIRVFDRVGQHVRTFGGQGEGPGEFSMLGWLGLAQGDTLASFDTELRRLTWFTQEGEVIHTLALDEAGGGGFPDPVGMLHGRMLVRSGFDRMFGEGERRDTTRLFLYDAAGTVADTVGAYPGPERYFYRAPDGLFAAVFEPIFARNAYASASANRLVVGASDRFELEVYDELTLSMKIISRVPQLPMGDEDIEAWRHDLREQQGERRVPDQVRQLMLAAVEDIPARRTTPAFQRLFTDSERRIWVEGPRRVPDAARHWVVLAADGIPIARIEMPLALEVFEIGEGYLLGLERDEQGVERIAVYTLEQSP